MKLKCKLIVSFIVLVFIMAFLVIIYNYKLAMKKQEENFHIEKEKELVLINDKIITNYKLDVYEHRCMFATILRNIAHKKEVVERHVEKHLEEMVAFYQYREKKVEKIYDASNLNLENQIEALIKKDIPSHELVLENIFLAEGEKIFPIIFYDDISEVYYIMYHRLDSIFKENIDFVHQNQENLDIYIVDQNGEILNKDTDIEDSNIFNKQLSKIEDRNIFHAAEGRVKYKNGKDYNYLLWKDLPLKIDGKPIKTVLHIEKIHPNLIIKKYYIITPTFYIIIMLLISLTMYIVFSRNLKLKENEFIKKLQNQKKTLETAIEGARDGLWDWDLEKGEVTYSDRWKEILGYKNELFENRYYFWENIIHKDDLKRVKKALKLHFTKKRNYYSCEYRLKTKNGDYKWIMDRGKAIFGMEDIPKRMVGYITDIDESKKNEEKLKVYFKGIENSPAVVIITDKNGIIEYVNKKFVKVTGYSKEEVIGKSTSILNHEKQDKQKYEVLWNTIQNKEDWEGEFTNQKKNGEIYYERAFISPILDNDGNIIKFMSVEEDITENKKLTEKLEYYATRDNLTGVYNRRMGIEFLKVQTKKVVMEKSYFSIIFADINDLKYVNDTCGHNVGDEMIAEVAAVMENHLRKSDMVARMGGDEFLLILHECTVKNAESIWKNIKKEIKNIHLSKSDIDIRVSHGVYEFNPENKLMKIEEILEIADKRMYDEKQVMKRNITDKKY